MWSVSQVWVRTGFCCHHRLPVLHKSSVRLLCWGKVTWQINWPQTSFTAVSRQRNYVPTPFVTNNMLEIHSWWVWFQGCWHSHWSGFVPSQCLVLKIGSGLAGSHSSAIGWAIKDVCPIRPFQGKAFRARNAMIVFKTLIKILCATEKIDPALMYLTKIFRPQCSLHHWYHNLMHGQCIATFFYKAFIRSCLLLSLLAKAIAHSNAIMCKPRCGIP